MGVLVEREKDRETTHQVGNVSAGPDLVLDNVPEDLVDDENDEGEESCEENRESHEDCCNSRGSEGPDKPEDEGEQGEEAGDRVDDQGERQVVQHRGVDVEAGTLAVDTAAAVCRG
jgi:hypothetical protein